MDPARPTVLPDLVASAVGRLLFVAYMIATAVHIGVVMAHEPFAFDAWNVAQDTHAAPFSLGNFLDYGVGQYLGSNPRVGQWFTYLAYKLEHFAVIATPVAYLALALAVTVLGLGRWPSWRRGRELALYAIALGFLWFAVPRIGMIMFCRAYGANYLYGAVIQLWFLVPLRLRPSGEAGLGPSTAYFLLGVVAGASNEHTGPTLVLFTLAYALWRRLQGGPRPTLALAGALGTVAGFAAIFFAPGQGHRYDGLATKVGLLERLLRRGVTGNLDIYDDFLFGAAPVLALIAIGLVLGARDPDRDGQRTPLRLVGWALLAGSLITATVFVSPKLGARFYLHACALLLAAYLGVADVVLTTTRRLVPFVLLAVATSVYAGVKTIPLYLRLHDASGQRLALLAAAPRGSVVTLPAFEQVADSWWFLGDDVRDPLKRDLIARYFGLRGVVHRANDLAAPLAVSDVRLSPRYAATPAGCVDEHGGLELGAFRGIDVGSIQRALRAGVADLRARLGAACALERLDLVVDFVGAEPPLPRPTIYLGRWFPDRFEAWAGAVERRGRWTTRGVVVPEPLRAIDREIFIYHVGGQARRLGAAGDRRLEYVPWARGTYWALACGPADCFVIAATRVL